MSASPSSVAATLTRRGFIAKLVLLLPASTISLVYLPANSHVTIANSKRQKSSSLPCPRAGLWWGEHDGHLTIYSAPPADNGVPLCWLNEVGAEIWLRLDGKQDPRQITTAVAHHFGFQVTSASIHETTRFLIELDQLGLLTGGCRFKLEQAAIKRS